jgi:hypothetical protein
MPISSLDPWLVAEADATCTLEIKVDTALLNGVSALERISTTPYLPPVFLASTLSVSLSLDADLNRSEQWTVTQR